MELELDGHTYRVGKMGAREQFHIVRRLAPVLGELAPALQGGKGGLDALPAIAAAAAKLSDADADYCIFGLLIFVSRKQPNGLGWGPVATGNLLIDDDIGMTQMLKRGPVATGFLLMYDDIGMTQMLKLAWEVLTFNMSGFFAALPSALKEATQKANGQ